MEVYSPVVLEQNSRKPLCLQITQISPLPAFVLNTVLLDLHGLHHVVTACVKHIKSKDKFKDSIKWNNRFGFEAICRFSLAYRGRHSKHMQSHARLIFASRVSLERLLACTLAELRLLFMIYAMTQQWSVLFTNRLHTRRTASGTTRTNGGCSFFRINWLGAGTSKEFTFCAHGGREGAFNVFTD